MDDTPSLAIAGHGPSHKIPTAFTHGPVIGSYQGHAIYESLVDNHGVKRVYAGLFTVDANQAPSGCVIIKGQLYTVSA